METRVVVIIPLFFLFTILPPCFLLLFLYTVLPAFFLRNGSIYTQSTCECVHEGSNHDIEDRQEMMGIAVQ